MKKFQQILIKNSKFLIFLIIPNEFKILYIFYRREYYIIIVIDYFQYLFYLSHYENFLSFFICRIVIQM